MINFWIYLTVFLITYVGVEIFRRWSLRRNLFDIPNERSSHTTPTPRGGGLIIVLMCLSGYTLLTIVLTGNFQWSYPLGALLIAFISWIDDVYSISFAWRFLVHAVSALLVILGLGYFEEIYFPFFQSINTGIIGVVITFLWIVWLTNAYNFMDGIDGIAGMQAVTAGAAWLLIGNFLNLPIASLYGGIIAFSSLGFLIQNWQPAKIFMGDVGSAFLGYSFAVLPLLAKNESGEKVYIQPILLPIAILLVWLFVFDTLWTFAKRALRKEKVWQAHRGHIYQKLVIARFSHSRVTSLYGLISLIIGAAVIFLVIKRNNLGIAMLLAIMSAIVLLTTSYLVQMRSEKSVER